MQRRSAFLLLVLVLISLALVLPARAQSGEWAWAGWLYLDSPYRSGWGCPWYNRQGSCSPWNYWTFHTSFTNNGDFSQCLTGYENGDRIRGQWIYPDQNRGSDPSFLGMGGYLKAQVTWWNYGRMYFRETHAYT